MIGVIRRADRTTRFVAAILALVGLILILVSLLVPNQGIAAYFHSLAKELGVVVLAVFTISLLYELWLAEKYEEHFLLRLRAQIEQGESNAAICAYLGIIQIFPTRDRYEARYPLRDLVSSLAVDSQMRIVGRSLFNLMTRPNEVKRAIQRGAGVELCLLDPTVPPEELRRSPDVEEGDILAALSVFDREVRKWLEDESPNGRISLRCHRVQLLDSYLDVKSQTYSLCAWEFSFGRNLGSKRVFVLEPGKALEQDLAERYGRIWGEARVVFEYDKGKITTNELKTVVRQSA